MFETIYKDSKTLEDISFKFTWLPRRDAYNRPYKSNIIRAENNDFVVTATRLIKNKLFIYLTSDFEFAHSKGCKQISTEVEWDNGEIKKFRTTHGKFMKGKICTTGHRKFKFLRILNEIDIRTLEEDKDPEKSTSVTCII